MRKLLMLMLVTSPVIVLGLLTAQLPHVALILTVLFLQGFIPLATSSFALIVGALALLVFTGALPIDLRVFLF